MARKASDKPKYVKRTIMLRQDQIDKISAQGAGQGREFSAHARHIFDDWFGPPRRANRGEKE